MQKGLTGKQDPIHSSMVITSPKETPAKALGEGVSELQRPSVIPEGRPRPVLVGTCPGATSQLSRTTSP